MATLVPQPHGGAINRWQPGESGNPAGPTPGRRLLTEALQETLAKRGGPKMLAHSLLDIALDPDNKAAVAAIKEAFLRLDGPAKGGGDSVPIAEARAMLSQAFEVIAAELDESTAERVVRAILDRMAGMRTVQAEVSQRDEPG